MISAFVLALAIVSSEVPSSVTEFELPNGIRVVSRHVESSQVEGLAVFLAGGSSALTPETQGIESFAIECALMGSQNWPGPAWRAMMDSTSASMSGAYAYDFSSCRLTCLTEDFPVLVRALADCLLEPEMDPGAVEQVRNSLVQGLQQEAYDPDSRVWLVANQGLMQNHPYSLRPDGTIETISLLTAAQAAEHLHRRMLAGNILITHSGPTPPEELEQLLLEAFGPVPSGRDEFLPPPAFLLPGDTLVLEVEEIPTAYAVAKFPGPPPGSRDIPVFRAGMEVVSEMLYQSLRTESALTYATYSGGSLNLRNWGYLYVSSANPVLACSLMAETYRAAAWGELDPELVRGTLETSRTAFSMQMASRLTQAYLMGVFEIATGDWRNAWLYSDIAAQCSPGEISGVLARYSGPVSWGVIADSSASDMVPVPIGLGE
jgi:predicted Zn-dependent peptidase